MKKLIFLAIVFAAVPAVAQYEAVILNTPGFTASWGYAASGGRQFGTSFTDGFTYRTATIWGGTASAFTTLNPQGWLSASVNGAQGDSQVGNGPPPATAGYDHALLWHGTPDSLVDLHPVGNFEVSRALGVWGSQQVGVAYEPFGGPTHAALWTGSAASFVDLTPIGSPGAGIRGVWDGVQVGGIAIAGTPIRGHAAYWRGTRESVVDIHPGGPYSDSDATGMAAGQIVGIGSMPNSSIRHALLWLDVGSPALNLHPANLAWSEALATNGIHEVGRARRLPQDWGSRAALWSGSAASYVDLHSFLPDSGFLESEARGIDEYGNVVGIASTFSNSYAVLWRPVPEPGTLSIMAVLVALASAKRRARRYRKPSRRNLVRATESDK